MADNVKITVNGGRSFYGRLIGFIDNHDCRALVNTADVARKISTERTMTRDDLPSVLTSKRFVLVTGDYSAGPDRDIFISPKIKYLSYIGADFNKIVCEGSNVYNLEFV